ncbi:MAG: replication initiator protein [Microviridae sp.]|nr:MAG: replication initiator protein [Microviridae sp.]
MCLYPKLIKNRKYTSNKKNGGVIPAVTDIRTQLVAIGCGNCIECRKQKAREWQVRLQEDIKKYTNGKFITLTLNDKSIKELTEDVLKYTNEEIEKLKKQPSTPEINKKIQKQEDKQCGYGLDNEIATRAVRLFLERWRKKYTQSVRHWLVTELGHNGTENIHLHGVIWTDYLQDIEDIWTYGHIWKGKKVAKTISNPNGIENYVNAKTVNYIVKYITKIDEKHTQYKSKILTSPGIGDNYIKQENGNWKKNIYNNTKTNETYRASKGEKLALPIYYRNHIYTDEEKEKLWIMKLDKQERYVLGQKIDISKGEEEYYKALKEAQELNKELGYRDNKKDWEQTEYENMRREYIRKIRIERAGNR